MKFALFFMVSALGLAACGKDKEDAPRPTVAAGPSAIEQGAEIKTVTLTSTDAAGASTYSFNAAALTLSGQWDRRVTAGLQRATGTATVNELEWLLVLKNIERLKAVTPADPTCANKTEGKKEMISVSMTKDGKALEAQFVPLRSQPYLCSKAYIANDTFDLIFNTVKGKLPQPTADSAYKPISG